MSMPLNSPVGVLIVDSQPVFRRAARDVIDAMSDFVLLGEATSGEHAIASYEELHPDLVLVDVRMSGVDGIETSKRLHAAHPEAVLVLVAVEDPDNLPAEVDSCGAAEVVRKQDFRPALLRRIWRAHSRP
jgi:two-component system NarL family response regulator